jgi:hypothetical protein
VPRSLARARHAGVAVGGGRAAAQLRLEVDEGGVGRAIVDNEREPRVGDDDVVLEGIDVPAFVDEAEFVPFAEGANDPSLARALLSSLGEGSMRRTCLLVFFAFVAPGCSGSNHPATTPPAGDDAVPPGGDGSSVDPTVEPSTPVTVGGPPSTCVVYEFAVPIQEPSGKHLPEGSTIAYDHNPPAGGPSYEMWAAYRRYLDSAQRGHWVHNLRHGAIVLVYRPDAPDDVVAALAQALPQVPTPGARAKPDCPHMGLMSPDPELADTYAVLAFGWMMTSNCTPQVADVVDFAQRHVYNGLEQECYDGAWPVRAPCFRFEDSPAPQSSFEVPEGTPVTYDHEPPTSGPFYPRTLRYGRYDVVVAEPYWAGILVKGGVVILYRPDAPADLVAQLKSEFDALPPHWKCGIPLTAMVQDTTLDHPFAMVAYGNYTTAQCLESGVVAGFVTSRRFNLEQSSCEDGTYVPGPPSGQ